MSQEERFIPVAYEDLVQCCLSLSPNESGLLNEFSESLQRYYHQFYFQQLNGLKKSYRSIDPDTDLTTLSSLPIEESNAFWPQLLRVLQQSNFEHVTQETLDQALKEESLFEVRLMVDFDFFEEVLFYYRGEQSDSVEINRWFGLKKKTIHFTYYDRVVVYVKFKPQAYFDERGISAAHFKPGSTMIKLFKNVPKADLEMLFPNAQVRMRNIDKLLIGVPALVGGGVVIATKLGSTLVLVLALFMFWLGFRKESVTLGRSAMVALGLGLGALAAHMWKQFGKFKNRKIRFMKTLSDNLYYKNLDNNAGVFHYLIDMAEQEECKEAFLAYWVLKQHGGMESERQLDRAVEAWLKEQAGVSLDFEVDDALNKLRSLGLIEEGKSIQAVSLGDAVSKMKMHWKQMGNVE